MTTIEIFEDDPSNCIWMDNGVINYESRFGREFNGDLKLLLSCVEGNVYEDGKDEEWAEEHIDYKKTIKDYKEALNARSKN